MSHYQATQNSREKAQEVQGGPIEGTFTKSQSHEKNSSSNISF